MTDSSSLPDSNQPSPPTQPKKPILSFDERVAIIIAFTTIGLILFWAWGGRKGKLFSQTWQALTSTAAKTGELQAEANKSFDIRGSIDPLLDKTDGAVLPKTLPLPTQTSGSKFSNADTLISKTSKTALDNYQQPIISLPTLPIAPTPPTIAETPTPTTPTPPTIAEPPTPTAPTPPTIAEPPTPTAPTPPTIAETPTPTIVTFDDVPRDYWGYPFIEPLIEKELIVGISEREFEPDLPITRAQLGAEIEAAFKQEQSRDLINFEDISQESKVSQKINQAVRTGFLKGYPGQVFRPDQKVPRLQVLVALVSGLGLTTNKDTATILSSYQDADQIPGWAKEKIAVAIDSGLIVNRPGFGVQQLYPNEFATRAEVVAMIYQGLVKVGRIGPISSPYVVPSP